MTVQEYQQEKVLISDLTFDSENPNTLTKEQIEAIRKSFTKFGNLQPITVDQHNFIVNGNHRALIYKELGIEEIPCYRREFKDDNERRLCSQTMNKLHGEYEKIADSNQLLLLFQNQKLDELAELIAQPKEDLKRIIAQGHPEMQFEMTEDAEELDKLIDEQMKRIAPDTQLGDIYQLGDHRLICADCTDKKSIDKLLEDKQPDIILTDPPYSSGGYQEAGKKAGSIGTRQNDSIRNDMLSTRGYQNLMNEAFNQVNAEVLYMFTDWRMWIYSFDISEKSGFGVRNMIVWDKMSFGMGYPWRSQHELILYGKKSNNKNTAEGNKGNVLQSKRTGNLNHPTEKPTNLISQLIENTKGNIVFDPFLGSGSTLIACEQTGRICRGVEIDPHYCDVVVKRWETYTGKKAVKL